jgi:hypothetical protein
MSGQQEQDNPNMEYIMLSQVASEFHIARATINWWVRKKLLPAKKMLSDLGVEYWVVRRGDVIDLLQNRPKRGRPLSRR